LTNPMSHLHVDVVGRNRDRPAEANPEVGLGHDRDQKIVRLAKQEKRPTFHQPQLPDPDPDPVENDLFFFPPLETIAIRDGYLASLKK